MHPERARGQASSLSPPLQWGVDFLCSWTPTHCLMAPPGMGHRSSLQSVCMRALAWLWCPGIRHEKNVPRSATPWALRPSPAEPAWVSGAAVRPSCRWRAQSCGHVTRHDRVVAAPWRTWAESAGAGIGAAGSSFPGSVKAKGCGGPAALAGVFISPSTTSLWT